jgi:hypothetical protein
MVLLLVNFEGFTLSGIKAAEALLIIAIRASEIPNLLAVREELVSPHLQILCTLGLCRLRTTDRMSPGTCCDHNIPHFIRDNTKGFA